MISYRDAPRARENQGTLVPFATSQHYRIIRMSISPAVATSALKSAGFVAFVRPVLSSMTESAAPVNLSGLVGILKAAGIPQLGVTAVSQAVVQGLQVCALVFTFIKHYSIHLRILTNRLGS